MCFSFHAPVVVLLRNPIRVTRQGSRRRRGGPKRAWRMNKTFSFTVNGQPRTVTTDPQRPLLDVLREDLQLTGAKYGCGEGQCRACTVLINGKSVASCLTAVSDAHQQKILTIEGLAQGDILHPL